MTIYKQYDLNARYHNGEAVDTDGYPLVDMADYWIVNYPNRLDDTGEYILDDIDAINEYLAEHEVPDNNNKNLVSAEMELLQNFYVGRFRWIESEQRFGNMPWHEDELKDSLTQGALK